MSKKRGTRGDKYPETKGAKWANLTSLKEGCTPEGHPIKQHRVSTPPCAINSRGRDRDDSEYAFQTLNCLTEQLKSKSSKEMSLMSFIKAQLIQVTEMMILP